MLRFLTAGESHGQALVTILEGMPAGLALDFDAITTELRRRVGGTFTIRELAEQYAVADAWAQVVLAEQAAPGWPRTLALVEGAAFHLYARGAVDYQP